MFCKEVTLDQKELFSLIKNNKYEWKTKIALYTPIQWGEINGRLGNAKFNSPMILIDYGASSSIIICKHVQKPRKKRTKQICRTTQGGDVITNYTRKVWIVLPELDETKIVTCNFYMDDLQVFHRYGIILGHDILSKLNMDLCFSNNTIRVNGFTYEGCTATNKYISKTISTCHIIDWNTKALGMNKYGRTNMRWIPYRVHHILDAHYKI